MRRRSALGFRLRRAREVRVEPARSRELLAQLRRERLRVLHERGARTRDHALDEAIAFSPGR